MKRYLICIIFLSMWSCGSNPESIVTATHVDTKAPVMPVENADSLNYRVDQKYIDSVWIQSDFDSSVAIILNGNRAMMNDLVRMDKMYGLSSRRKLNAMQFESITAMLSGKMARTYTPADCFQPYHGFLFYKRGRVKARVAICFSCGTYFSLPLRNGGIQYETTKQIFKELGLPVYNWDDSTETANSKIKYSDYF